MTAEEVDPLLAPAQVDPPRLLRMQLELELAEELPHTALGFSTALLRLAQHDESSSPGGPHPRALIEPDVKLSPHPAPPFQPRVSSRAATGRTAWAPVARCAPTSATTLVL